VTLGSAELKHFQTCPTRFNAPYPLLYRLMAIRTASPLTNARHEAFALAVSNGSKLIAAYEIAGFSGRSRASASILRWRPDVDSRIRWLAKQRVERETRAFARRRKLRGDLLDRATQELAAIALFDLGEVLNWERRPVVNDAGEVTGYATQFQVKDSAKLTAPQRAAIKAVFSKSGELRVELADKLTALATLIKTLTRKDVPTASSITINQQNVGEVSALDAARKVAFLLAASRAQALPVAVTNAMPVRNSKGADIAPAD
jgi:hypothetical protein